MTAAHPEPRTRSLPDRIVFYDGVCGFCNRTARWLIDRDPHGRLHYAPLQGETAVAARARHPAFPEDIDTLVLLERDPGGEHLYLRSDAALRVAEAIEGPWRRLAWLRVVPRPIRDWAYRLFARNRYRMFGQLESCPVPSEAERTRFVA